MAVYRLEADAGSISLTQAIPAWDTIEAIYPNWDSADVAWDDIVFPGAEVEFEIRRAVVADAGSVIITGTASGLYRSRRVVVSAGSAVISGTPASLVAGRKLPALPGAVTVTGQPATFQRSRKVTAGAGAVSIAGAAAGLFYGRIAHCDAGQIDIAGSAAGFRIGRVLVADSGSIIIAGTDAHLSKAASSVLPASPGAVVISGANVGLRVGRAISAISGAVSIVGTDADFSLGAVKRIEAEPGSIVVSGQDAALIGPDRSYVTSSGGVGTSWSRKTLSQIEREKKAALKRARNRVVRIIERDPPQLTELLQVVRAEVHQQAPSLPSNITNDIISRLHGQMRAALIRRIEEDEAEAELLLLVA